MLGREFDFNSYEERGSTHSFGTGSAATSQPSRGVTDAGRAGDRDRDKGGGPSGGGSPSGTVQRTFLRKGRYADDSLSFFYIEQFIIYCSNLNYYICVYVLQSQGTVSAAQDKFSK